MRKTRDSGLSNRNPKSKVSKDNEEDVPEFPEEDYAAKSFIRNLSISLGKDPASLYPEKADKIFRINDLVDLRLINKKTYIYINNERFVACLNVLLNIETDILKEYDNIRNMDQASRVLGSRYGQWFTRISPEEEFMAHCSNIQAFFENELNTDLLHSDIAFPLLKKLVNLGFQPAMQVFNKEIVKRFNEGTWVTRRLLKSEGYLKYLNKEGKRALKNYKRFKANYRTMKIFDRKILSESPKIYKIKRLKLDDFEFPFPLSLLSVLVQGLKSKRQIRVFEFDDVGNELKEITKKLPISTLLNPDKILIFNDPMKRRSWMWHGFNTTTRMRNYAKVLALKNIKDTYGIDFKLNSIDEGLEPLQFKNLMNLEKEPNYQGTKQDLRLLKSLIRERLQLFLIKFQQTRQLPTEIEIDGKKYDFREIQRSLLGMEITEDWISSKDDFNSFFNLVEEGITKIKSIMKEQSVDELDIHRQYVFEIFNQNLLKLSKDGFPTFKPGVTACFEFTGIRTIEIGNNVKFLKRS